LTARLDAGSHTFDVGDNRIGIERQYLAEIFKPLNIPAAV
jgi:hypothetical protein